jgi:hypothetical protein
MRNDAPSSTSAQSGHTAPGTDLPLGRYAEALATILHYRPEQAAEVVARLGLTSEAWEAAEKAWTEILTCPGNRTDGAIALEFTSLFARTRKRLSVTKPRIAKVGPMPVAVPAIQALPPLATSAPEPTRAAEVPSYLREERPTPAPDRVSPPPPRYAPTMALPIMRPDEVIAPVMPAHPAAMLAPTPSEDEDVNETAEVDVRCFRKPLPFADARAMPSAEPVAIPPAGKRLIRFDPQTGEPLSSPRWADVPVVDGAGKLASFGPSPQCDEPTGHETAAIPILRTQPVSPVSSSGAPSRDAESSWNPK